MRLLAVTYGTEGDTRPLVMLCHGLQAAGHEVMVLAEGGTLGSAQALGVPHAALEGDIHDEVVALVSRAMIWQRHRAGWRGWRSGMCRRGRGRPMLPRLGAMRC